MNFRTFLLLFCVYVFHQVSVVSGSKLHRYSCSVCQHGGSETHFDSLHACKRPPPPSPGYIRCTYDNTHMKCKGECPSGYKFPDGRTEIEIQCSSSDAVWYPIRSFPDCVSQNYRPYDQSGYQNLNDHSVTLKRCKRPNPPAYGAIRCYYDSENLFCTATCNSGYYFPGGKSEMQLQCNIIKALWYPTSTFPDCIGYNAGNQPSETHNEDYQGSNSGSLALTLSRCQRPPSPIPGRISCTYDHSKMICTGTCDSGHSFPNGMTEMILQCNTRDAYWYPQENFPTCVRRDYGGNVETSQGGNEEKIYAVTLIRCRKPEAPISGYSFCKYDAVSMNCTGTCKTSYYFPNGKREMVLQCRTENGVWFPRGEYPACSPFDNERYTDTSQQQQQQISHQLAVTLNKCGRKDAPAGGYVNCKYDALGMNCTGTCRTNYYFPGRRAEIILQCRTANGIWYPRNEFPSCSYFDNERYADTSQQRPEELNSHLAVTLNRCGRKEAPADGYVNCRYDALGMNCTGTCRSSYYFPGGRTEIILQCRTDNGIWYPRNEFPSCSQYDYGGQQTTEEKEEKNIYAAILIKCIKPVAPEYGESFCKYDTASMNCTGSCRTGYYFPNGKREMILQCRRENGVWFPQRQFPACSQFDNEKFTDTTSQQQQQHLDNQLAATLIKCRKITAPVGGYVNCKYDALGMNCTGTCRVGYHFPERSVEIILQCQTENGIWYPRNEFPSCARIENEKFEESSSQQVQVEENKLLQVTLMKCSKRAAPSSGYVYCNHDIQGMNCTGICRTGFHFFGGRRELLLQCKTENGIWYPEREFPACIRVDSEINTGGRYDNLEEEENRRLSDTLNRCGKTVAPVDGYVNCTYDVLGMNCTGTCKTNYYFPDGRIVHMLYCRTETRTWYPRNEFPACIRYGYDNYEDRIQSQHNPLAVTLRVCGEKEAPVAGFMNCKYDAVGMNCTGTCRRGYYFPGGRSEMIIQCRTDIGIWYPRSEFLPCEEYDSERHIETTLQQSKQEDVNSQLAVTLRTCIKRAAPISGYIYCGYDALGMNCTGRCKLGYYFPDGKREIVLQCQTESGRWYPREDFPTCSHNVGTLSGNINEDKEDEDKKCPIPLSPLHGYISCSDSLNDRICVGRCDLGYRFPNGGFEMTLKCSKDGVVWYPSQRFPDCIPEVKEDETLPQTNIENPNSPENFEYADDKCTHTPNPPLTGFISCLNYTHSLRCTGTCMPGYTYSTGKTSMTLSCSLASGKWTPFASFPPCILEEYNPNVDTGGEETFKPEDRNPTSSEICPKPLTPKGGYIHCEQQFSQGYRRCTGTCMPGFSFPNGENTMIIQCSTIRGWLPTSSFPSCKAIEDGTYNPETETSPTTSVNNEGYRPPTSDNEQPYGPGHDYGNRGDIGHHETGTGSANMCIRPVYPKHGDIYCVTNGNAFDCTAKCAQGFRFPNGENRLIYRCDTRSGRWNPQNQFPDCISACDVPCNNGGVCVRPNQCYCPQDYRGNFCQYPLSNCDPQHLKFAGSIRCNHTTEETVCTLGCPQGMILEPSYNTVRCNLQGTWSPHIVPRCVEDPRYRDVDTSGHVCPYTHCTSVNSYEGGLCRRPAPPKPGRIRCIYNQLMMECTSKCADGYKYPNDEVEQIRTCDNKTGIWSPPEYFTDCQPTCERECLNGGKCLAPNFCFCPVKFRGNQCQYPLSNCDPHRLRFAGSIRCNHSSEETVCHLGCPDGTMLDNPSYGTLHCSLDGIWSPRYVPRCIEATIPRRPTHSDNRLNQDFQHEYSQNNYEQRYQQSQTDHQRLNNEQLQHQSRDIDQYTQDRMKNLSREQYNENQRLTSLHRINYEQLRQAEESSSENFRHSTQNKRDDENFRDSELEKESAEARLKNSQEQKEFERILKQNMKNHSDYHYEQRRQERLEHRNQQTEATHSEANRFHQNNQDGFKHYDKLQTNMDYEPYDKYPPSDTHHTGEEEIRGYGHRYYHHRINRSESGTYKEQSAQQHHYFHQYQRTGHKNTDKHSCLLCSTG